MGMDASAYHFYGVVIGGSETGYLVRPPEWAASELRYYLWEKGEEASEELDAAADRAEKDDVNLLEWQEHLYEKAGLGNPTGQESTDERFERWAKRRELIKGLPCEVLSWGVDDCRELAVIVKESQTMAPEYGHSKVEHQETDVRWRGQIRAFMETLNFRPEDIDGAECAWYIAADYG